MSYGGDRQGDGYGGGRRDEYDDQGGRGGGHGGDGNYSSGGGRYEGGGSAPDFSGALEHAQNHADGGGSSGLFGQALGFLQQNTGRLAQGGVDEDHMVNAHQQLYNNNGGGQQHDANSLGAGAAMQALKMFSSGGGGGGGQNQFIGMAMAQAEKLWDQQNSNGNVTTDKQSAVTKAAEMAFKMYSHGGGSGLGGTGGPGGLMSLASKFL